MKIVHLNLKEMEVINKFFLNILILKIHKLESYYHVKNYIIRKVLIR